MTSRVVDRGRVWPNARLELPISATAYESLLACPLQLLYVRDPTFPRRNGAFARIGVAFHKALEGLADVLWGSDLPQAAQALVSSFREELQAQREAARTNSREAKQAWPDSRIHHAEQALALLVHRAWVGNSERVQGQPRTSAEVAITSHDGFLRGVIDRVERGEDGVTLVDYKSAEAIDDEHLARFKRQLLIYGYLWFDATGIWPVKGVVHFVVLGREVALPLEAEEAQALVRQMRAAVEQTSGLDHAKLARPGAACQHCDYRPWCGPFWETPRTTAARLASVEGIVVGHSDRSPRVIWVELHGSRSQVVLSDEMLSRREELGVGTHLRVIDAAVDGLPPVGRYRLTDRSELWTVS